jgi:CRISPR-associated protein (TIGR02584 family)
MGFYAGSALALFGRPQDRLSHVLVDPPFESHPNFFYPTRRRNIIYTAAPDSRPLDTSAAVVTLADIPFVRLRQWLPDAVLQKTAGWGETVAVAQKKSMRPR